MIASRKISPTDENILNHTVSWVATSASIIAFASVGKSVQNALTCLSITFYEAEKGDGQTPFLNLIKMFMMCISARCSRSLGFDSSQVILLADRWGQMTGQSLPSHPAPIAVTSQDCRPSVWFSFLQQQPPQSPGGIHSATKSQQAYD